jgi:hypothetical protein
MNRRRLQEDSRWTQYIGIGSETRKLKGSSHYHKCMDFQDKRANLEFFGLAEDLAFKSWGISAVRFSGYYGIIVDFA